MPIRGSSFNNTSNGGAGALNLNNPRSNVNNNVSLSVLLTFVGGVTAAAVAFYCWKAKAENLLKIKAAYPELSGTLSDFSSMTQ